MSQCNFHIFFILLSLYLSWGQEDSTAIIASKLQEKMRLLKSSNFFSSQNIIGYLRFPFYQHQICNELKHIFCTFLFVETLKEDPSEVTSNSEGTFKRSLLQSSLSCILLSQKVNNHYMNTSKTVTYSTVK